MKLFETNDETYSISFYDMDWWKEYYISQSNLDYVPPATILDILAEAIPEKTFFYLSRRSLLVILYNLLNNNHENVGWEIAKIESPF